MIRAFKQFSRLVLLLFLFCVSMFLSQVAPTAGFMNRQPFLVANDGHPKWATDGRQDSNIVYFKDRTHIAYESSEGLGYQEPFPGPSGAGGYIKIITFDHTTGQWIGPFKVSDTPVYDEHGYPDLAVDSKGYLHIVYDGHQTSLKYKRSLRANDPSAWTASEDVGERATYPHLFVGTNDTLFLFYRERGQYYDRWVEDMRTRPVGGQWTSPRTILDAEWKRDDPANDFCVYVQSVLLGQDSKVYLTWSWENRGVESGFHNVGFAKSSDFGKTWTWANGLPYTLPIKRTAKSEELWSSYYPSYHTGLAASKRGQVMILLFNYSHGWANAQIHQRLWNGSKWESSNILTGVLNAEIMIDDSGIAHGLAMTAADTSGFQIKYLESKPPYNKWIATTIGSPPRSFYPTVKPSPDGIFEGTWHTRVSQAYSEVYYYASSS